LEPRAFDPEYLAGLRDGDPAIGAHFVAYFGRLIFLKFHRRMRSREMLEETRQETFARVLAAIREGRLENAASLGAYVARVAENVFLEMVRQRGRFEPGPVPDVPHQPGLDQAMIDSERRSRVRTLLKRMSARDRLVLRMLFYEDLDAAEVCSRLGIRPEYLKMLVHRARRRFQARFRPGELENW
jgi:RNA polymerase sigma factor (sigma-70 family)